MESPIATQVIFFLEKEQINNRSVNKMNSFFIRFVLSRASLLAKLIKWEINKESAG
jgi:hypothetical protein